MERRHAYEMLSAAALSLAGVAGLLALAGAALQQTLSVAASSLCFVLFLVPGLWFLSFARRLRSRDIALAHTAAFARSRGTLELEDLAAELHVSCEEAGRILRLAIEEGHVRGRFVATNRFVAAPADVSRSQDAP
ncbi:MAG: hypothetical protein L3J78_03815 [Thermoplasmata archaeon]|nr:hypothetical protein [Thermoplasmata archaeon]